MRNHVTPNDIPGEVREVCSQLHRHGFRAWVVGGCMRDLLREKPASDWDLATSARPEEVQRVFKRVIPTGIQHGTVTVRLHGHSYEVTTLRGEGAYSDGRRPDNVEFVTEIEADLSRRDFTINAIAYDPIDDQLTDPFDGLGDLQRGVVRAVGDARRRFSEDGLRVLRAARFAATLEFTLDADTEAAIAPTLETFRRVSAERVREEWLKALKARKPSVAFDIMARTGMLSVTAPMLAELTPGQWRLALAGLDAVDANACLRLAALFAQVRDLDALSDWLTRYRFSNNERELLLSLLKHPFATLPADATDADLRRYARKVGREAVFDVAYLGGIFAMLRDGQDSSEARVTQALATRLKQVVTDDTALTTKELSITGRDLMVALSIAPGPEVGKLLDRLLERVIDDPRLNTREELLSCALQLRAEG